MASSAPSAGRSRSGRVALAVGGPRLLAVAVLVVALCATAAAALQPAAPYTIRTSTDAQLVDVDDPLLNFTRHEWRSDDEVWALATPFPVVFYGVEYNEIGVSSNANIQFSQSGSYSNDYNIDSFPYSDFHGALMAMQTDMSTSENDDDDIRSGVVGQAPNRIFVVDYQGAFLSNSQKVHLQFHFHEDSLTVSIVYGSGCNFLAPLIEPDDDDPINVGVQQFQDTGLSTQYKGDLEDSLRIDFDTKPFVGFTGIPAEALLIPRGDIATLTLAQSIGVAITGPTDFTLTCVAPTAATLTFPLRLCPLTEGAEPCTSANATTVEFRAADYAADAEFVCTLTAAAPTDAVLLVAPFAVSIRLPRLSFGLPESALTLTVPTGSYELVLSPPRDMQLPASINVTLTCTLAGAPTLTFDFSLCVEGDSACVSSTSALFQTNAQMPTGAYSCVPTLGEGSAASPLYNLAAPFAVGVIRPKPGYKLTQSTASPFSIEGFTDHGWAGNVNYAWELQLPFPVRVFNGSYSKIGLGAGGNIQFSKAWGYNSWTTIGPIGGDLPYEYLGTALMAFQASWQVTAVHSGVVGQAPSRIFVIDVQGNIEGRSLGVQYLLSELAVGSRLSVIYSGFPDIVNPMGQNNAVALQSRDLEMATIFDGTLTGTTRLDYDQHQLYFSGVPTAPIRGPDGAAQITLEKTAVLELAESAEFTLTCTSATANQTFPLRLCAEGDAGCASLTAVDFSAAGVTAPVTFNCSSAFVGLSSLDYLLPAPFLVTLLPPVSVTNDWTLTVSRPAPLPTRVFTNADATQSPIELPVAAGPRAAVGSDAASLTHWMSGSNCRLDGDAPGHVEPSGAASDANTPGARVYASSWTGKDGQLYLYSGIGATSFVADLWRYSPVSGQWSQLPMPTSTVPVYGTRGQPSSETTPGGREQGCAAVDDNGDAWLFGGYTPSENALGDVFKFTVSSGEWTFVAGSSTSSASPTVEQGVGVPIAGNFSGPGSRAQPSCAWSNGKLFVFGGEGSGIHNDLWSYEPVADQWTWISGAQSINTQSVHARVMAVGDSPATPPARWGAFMAAAADGKLWLIGGEGDSGYFADVWSFDPVSGAWAFEAGSQSRVTPFQSVHGRIRVPAASNLMAGRKDFAAAFDKRAGVIFISGGLGKDDSGYNVYLADVWSFNVTSKLFTFIGGTTAVNGGAMGAYPAVKGFDGGELRAARPNNYAGSAWVDASGGLWLGMGRYFNWQEEREQRCNDLWFMPSDADVVTLDLTAAGFDSTVISAEPSLTRLGRNRWTLGRPELDGSAKEFTFTVVGGTGVAAAPFTLRLLQREPFTDKSWSAAVAAPGLTNPVALTQASDAAAGLIALPAESALSLASITLTLPTGATVSPAATNGVLSVRLGAAGTNSSLTFTVIAENGAAAAPFTVTFAVAAPPQPEPEPSSTGQSGSEASSSSTGQSGTDGQIRSSSSSSTGAAGQFASSGTDGPAEDSSSSSSSGPATESSTGTAPLPTSSTGSAPSATSSTGSAASPTFAAATVTMQLNFNRTTLPPTLIADTKAGISAAIRFPSKAGQVLLVAHQFVSRRASGASGASARRRLLAAVSVDDEVTQLTVTFTPADARDDGAAKAALALSAQLKCLTAQCAADAAAAAGVDSVRSAPQLAALLAAVDPDSVGTIDGVTPPPPQPDDDDGDSGLSDGAIAGIVIGVVVGSLLLAGAAFYVVRARSPAAGKATAKVHSAGPANHQAAAEAELAQLPATEA